MQNFVSHRLSLQGISKHRVQGLVAAGLLAAWGLGSCAKPAPSAAAPATSVMPPAAPAPTLASPSPAPTESAAPAAPVEAPAPAPTPPPVAADDSSRRQPPIEMLTARDIAFLVEYSSSDARQTAESECDRDAKGDLEARAACLQKARDKFLPDVLRFQKDANGRSNLVIYKRNGSTLREVYIGAIEFKDEEQNRVKLRFTGREKGTRPLFRGTDGVISVPNDYSIEIEDSQWGKLTYTAKIGLVNGP